ncbi:MAG: TIGR02757 family protein [Muribaculaceae bacterium]|nr:TIGR02757 family protein [Muribaculaceae bacterium]
MNHKKISREIVELLDSEAERINCPAFIDKDPVQFPRRFESLQDIEIVSFLAAMLAWGNRKMICRDIEKLLSLLEYNPYKYMLDRGYEDLDPKLNIHRTFFASHLKHFLRGLRAIYEKYGSLDAFALTHKVGESDAPAWKLVEEINRILERENGEASSRCLPLNLKNSALKRVNMALRWLVRDDGIVDMGVWKSIPKHKLYIPLDVHVGNVSRELGLLERKANDRRSVEELTACLRTLRPDDPAIYDFALFGIGIGE